MKCECGYEINTDDDGSIRDFECPQCGELIPHRNQGDETGNVFASKDYIKSLEGLSHRKFKDLYLGTWIPPQGELQKELGFFGKPSKRDHTLDDGTVVNVDILPGDDTASASTPQSGDDGGAA